MYMYSLSQFYSSFLDTVFVLFQLTGPYVLPMAAKENSTYTTYLGPNKLEWIRMFVQTNECLNVK